MEDENLPTQTQTQTSIQAQAQAQAQAQTLTKEKPKCEHTVDEVIENYIGSLGVSQIIQVVLVSFAWVFDAQSSLVTIFSDAEPSWRCRPGHGACHGTRGSVCGLEPGSWEWVGGHKSTTIAEWGLICHHKFMAAMPASAFFIGSLIGSAIYGRLADSILGRKKTLIISCLLTSITGFLTSLSPNIWIYALLRFSNGLSRSGIGICCLVLATEIIGRKWRGQVGQYGFFFYTLGFLTIPLIAFYNKNSWRPQHRIIAAFPFVYSLLILRLVEESPRWLLIRGRKSQALGVLTRLARRNRKTIPSDLRLLDPNLSDGNFGNDTDTGAPKMGLWGCKWARIRMLIAMAVGFGVGVVYFGIQLNVENLNFSKYLTVAINGLMEIPAVFLGSLFLGFMKRRVLFALSSYTVGLSCLLCIVFTKSRFGVWGSYVQLGFDAIGFLTASMAFDVLYIYSVELFATNVRNFAVSMLRQSLMLGASMAPVFVAVGRLSPALSFLVFGGFSVVSGVVCMWLPETKNSPLYETLEQQEKEEKLLDTNSREIALSGGQRVYDGVHTVANCSL